jgi:hypothetical protein
MEQNLKYTKKSDNSKSYVRMNSIRLESYEIKISKNSLKIPVINGVHLHSMYNPAKEAQAIVSKFDQNLSNKNKVLVLGLGFAYHIYEIARKLQSYHDKDYHIVVIEPNEQVYKDCVANNLFPNENITVYAGEDLNMTYGDINLVKFLIDKPTVISHPASFELYGNFFKSFLEYKAPRTISQITKYIDNRELKSYLYKANTTDTIEKFVQNNVLAGTQLNNDFDHLMLAYSHLSSGEL